MIALEILVNFGAIAIVIAALVAVFVVVVRIADRNVSAEGFAETFLLDRDQHETDIRDAMQERRAT